jgi:hypothetical protein
MKEIRVKLTPTDLIQTSQELKAEGLVQGKDFDFAYHQSKWDDMIGEIPSSIQNLCANFYNYLFNFN